MRQPVLKNVYAVVKYTEHDGEVKTALDVPAGVTSRYEDPEQCGLQAYMERIFNRSDEWNELKSTGKEPKIVEFQIFDRSLNGFTKHSVF